MKLRIIFTIFKKDVWQGPKNPFFLIAIVIPIIFTLLVNLIFGSLFAQQPIVGIYDQGDSVITNKVKNTDSFIFKEIKSEKDLLDKVESHNLDAGFVLEKDFDQQLQQAKKPKLTVYFSGESLASNRLIVISSLAQYIRAVSQQSSPIEIEQKTLGEGESFPLKDRFLPLILIMTVFITGTFMPALLLVQEREKRTLQAMTITPANTKEILTAKGLVGLLLGLVTGLMAMLLNNALSHNFWLIFLFLSLGLIMAVEIGLILGSLCRDYPSLMTYIKSIQLLIFAPVIIYLFPKIPKWIGQIFPTYYFIDPLFEVAIKLSSWPTIQTSFFILAGILLILLIPVIFISKRLTERG